MTRPPIPTSKSATRPIVGLAEIPEKPSEAPHSVPMQSLERGAGDLCCSINGSQACERLANRLFHHFTLGGIFLLFEDKHWFVECGASFRYFVFHDRNLGMLATQA